MDEGSHFNPMIAPIEEHKLDLGAIHTNGRRIQYIINEIPTSATKHSKHSTFPRNGIGWFENLEEEKVPYESTPEHVPEPEPVSFRVDESQSIFRSDDSPAAFGTLYLSSPNKSSLKVKELAKNA